MTRHAWTHEERQRRVRLAHEESPTDFNQQMFWHGMSRHPALAEMGWSGQWRRVQAAAELLDLEPKFWEGSAAEIARLDRAHAVRLHPMSDCGQIPMRDNDPHGRVSCCEFCYAPTPPDTRAAGWDLLWQSWVCPLCADRVKMDGGYSVVRGGAYATRPDPRLPKPHAHPSEEEIERIRDGLSHAVDRAKRGLRFGLCVLLLAALIIGYIAAAAFHGSHP